MSACERCRGVASRYALLLGGSVSDRYHRKPRKRSGYVKRSENEREAKAS